MDGKIGKLWNRSKNLLKIVIVQAIDWSSYEKNLLIDMTDEETRKFINSATYSPKSNRCMTGPELDLPNERGISALWPAFSTFK